MNAVINNDLKIIDKLINTIKKCFIFEAIWLLTLIIYVIVDLSLGSSISADGFITDAEYNSALVFTGVGVTFLVIFSIIVFVFAVFVLIQTFSLESKINNANLYSEIGTLKIIAIIHLILGFFVILGIIMFVMCNNLRKVIQSGERIANVQNNYSINNQMTKNNNSGDLEQIEKAYKMYKDGILSKEEFEKIKSENIKN